MYHITFFFFFCYIKTLLNSVQLNDFFVLIELLGCYSFILYVYSNKIVNFMFYDVINLQT